MAPALKRSGRKQGNGGSKSSTVGSEATEADVGERILTTSWKLVLERQPDEYPFAHQPFDVEAFLVDAEGDVIRLGEHDLQIEARLRLLIYPTMTEVEATGVRGGVLSVIDEDGQEHYQHPTVKISRTGFIKATVKVLELASAHNNHQFCIEVSPIAKFPIDINSDHLIERVESISAVTTKPFKVVKRRLKITQNVPELWFKDQGGRENCISVQVGLASRVIPALGYDPEYEDPVPLEVSLVYENMEKVHDPKGNILNIHSDSVLEVSKFNIEAVIKFRIEDVSKNHQSKAFCLLVEPKKTSSNHDISPILSNPVLVKSKPNVKKNTRKKSSSAAQRKKARSDTLDSEESVKPKRNGTPSASPVINGSLGPNMIPQTLRVLMDMHIARNLRNASSPLREITSWTDELKDLLLELNEASMRKQAIESKIWLTLARYPQIQENCIALNGESGLTNDQSLLSLNRTGSLNSQISFPGLTKSTQQLIAGISSDILLASANSIGLTSGNSVGLMLSGLQAMNGHDSQGNDFASVASNAGSSDLGREHSLFGLGSQNLSSSQDNRKAANEHQLYAKLLAEYNEGQK